MKQTEDQILREIILSSQGTIDLEYDVPIACDKNGKWYTAKELSEQEETGEDVFHRSRMGY